ncbi:hypothetical protein PC0027_07070 [Streptococcus pneumoniae]|nr:hypothetical protein PC0027_07070 [Streptococcus pneumoniae]
MVRFPTNRPPNTIMSKKKLTQAKFICTFAPSAYNIKQNKTNTQAFKESTINKTPISQFGNCNIN